MVRRAIAVVVDGAPTPAWQARALAGLDASPALSVVEVRLAGRPHRGLVRRLHGSVEQRLFGVGRDALAPVEVVPRAQEAEAATLVVWLAERPLPTGESRDMLYTLHEGAAESADAAFGRAVLDGTPAVRTDVLLRGEGGALTLVARTVSGVRPFSATLSRNLALWKLAAVVLNGVERIPGLGEPWAPPAPARPPQLPSTAALLRHSLPSWARALRTRLLFRRPWSIRLREHGSAPTAGWERPSRELVRWGSSPVYADPFLFEHEGRHHLFCEEVRAGTSRGVISHTELRLDGVAADPPTPVLEAPFHLSYPCVFAHDGEIFMLPETSAVLRVELYRAVDFPRAWVRDAILLDDVDAADSTIVAHDGRLWLFAGVAPADASSLDELHLYWADALRGPWHPHPRNPIVSDVRGARPAGPIQQRDGRLVRPGQDGSRRYGWAISFREIDVLTPLDYAEHEVDRLEPSDLGDARATHHYSSDGRFEAVDLRRRASRLRFGRKPER